MSGYRMWRLAILIPLVLLKFALRSSHDDYDYTPPSYYTPPNFNYTPPPLPTAPDPTDDPPAKLIDALQIEDGDAPDLASAKADMEPVVATPAAFQPSGEPAAPHVMLGDHAAIGITLADPGVIVGKRWLATWNLSPAQALAVATANLRQDHIQFTQVEPGVWSTPDDDSLGASRILLVDEIKKLPLKGGAVAMIPNRGTLLLAGAKDAKGLAAMATRADDLEGSAHAIHSIPLCLTGNAWRECVPKVGGDAEQQLGDLAAKGREAAYDAISDTYQKELGDDIFVAHVKVISPDEGPSFTIVNWMKDYPSMLPKADQVAFVLAPDPEHPTVLGLAPWDRVMKVVGPHLKPNGRMPTYWATDGWFPSEAQLKQLALKPLQ
jgi:hypothetical protein